MAAASEIAAIAANGSNNDNNQNNNNHNNNNNNGGGHGLGGDLGLDFSEQCPRCGSYNTKFCYFNNYSFTQPRHYCKECRRYWTLGGICRAVPIGGGTHKRKRGNGCAELSAQADQTTLFLSPPRRRARLTPPDITALTSQLRGRGELFHPMAANFPNPYAARIAALNRNGFGPLPVLTPSGVRAAAMSQLPLPKLGFYQRFNDVSNAGYGTFAPALRPQPRPSGLLPATSAWSHESVITNSSPATESLWESFSTVANGSGSSSNGNANGGGLQMSQPMTDNNDLWTDLPEFRAPPPPPPSA